jgi:hypothetical protein
VEVHVPRISSVLPLALPLALLSAAACSQVQHNNPAANPLACTSSEMLVVDNHSSYPVRVYGTEGGLNAPPNSAVTYATVPSGTVDTVRSMPGGNRQVGIVVDRPPLPSGALEKTSGISTRCVPRA